MEENIISSLNALLDARGKNKTLDVNSMVDERREFLAADLKESYATNAWHDYLALEWNQWLAFGVTTVSCGALAQVIRKSFKARRYKMITFTCVGVPLLAGSMSAMASEHFVDDMLMLQANCRQCYQMKMVGMVSVVPLINQALFSTALTWLGQNQKKDIRIYRRLRTEDSLGFGKRLLFDYQQKIAGGHVWKKTLVFLVVTSALAYLLSLEQQREFIVVFTKYYEDLLEDVQLRQDGINRFKNAQL